MINFIIMLAIKNLFGGQPYAVIPYTTEVYIRHAGASVMSTILCHFEGVLTTEKS